MDTDLLASVIVPARNAEATLGRCLEALAAQTVPPERLEIVVVDDGSTDRTAAVAEEHDALVVKGHGEGPGAARNRGVAASSGPVLLFTDADCEPCQEWAESLLEALEKNEAAGAKGTYRSSQTAWTARFVQAEYESRYRSKNANEPIDFVDTYSAAYRREVFEKAGGFDETFPVDEDQELSYRLAGDGVRLVYAPKAVVGHLHAAGPWTYFRKKVRIAFWKVEVLGRYPDRAVRDSHTPFGLKAEIACFGGAVLTLPVALLFPSLWWVPTLLGAGFLGAGTPFCWRVATKDRGLALRAPFFLALRAVALGTGFAAGLLRRRLYGPCPERRGVGLRAQVQTAEVEA